MFPGNFMMGGWWVIFPIIGVIVMFVLMYMMMGRGGFRRPRGETRREPRKRESSETPLEILKKRYARGEISKEEYEEMKKDL